MPSVPCFLLSLGVNCDQIISRIPHLPIPFWVYSCSCQQSPELPWCTTDLEPFFLGLRCSPCWFVTPWRGRWTPSPGPGTNLMELSPAFSSLSPSGQPRCPSTTFHPICPHKKRKITLNCLQTMSDRWIEKIFLKFFNFFRLQLMAKHLQVPLCPLSFKEAKLKFGRKKIE